MSKIFFQIILNEVLKNNNKQRNWQLYLVTFHEKYLRNVKDIVEQTFIFHLLLLGIPSSLMLSMKNMGDLFNEIKSKSVKHDKSKLSTVPKLGHRITNGSCEDMNSESNFLEQHDHTTILRFFYFKSVLSHIIYHR